MLIYDVTKAQSFENISRWLHIINDHAPSGVVKMLLGNNCDMENERCITRTRGEVFAREHGLLFMEVSAENNISIQRAFFEMNQHMLEKAERDPLVASAVSIKIAERKKQSKQSSCM